MWDDLVNNLPKYANPILTGVDAGGYPFSIRCEPELDQTQERLHVNIFSELPIEQGPASLMCHSHDELLWDLSSFLVRGRLEKVATGWVFYPDKFIRSDVSSSPVAQMKGVFKMRKRAKKYLAERGLPWPTIPWDDIKALRAEAKED